MCVRPGHRDRPVEGLIRARPKVNRLRQDGLDAKQSARNWGDPSGNLVSSAIGHGAVEGVPTRWIIGDAPDHPYSPSRDKCPVANVPPPENPDPTTCYSSRSKIATPTAARPGKNKLDGIEFVKTNVLPVSAYVRVVLVLVRNSVHDASISMKTSLSVAR